MQSDRNLLYGMLAYQTGYIDKNQLVEAMHAWTEAKQESIATILLDRGYLQPDDRQDLDKIIERKLKQFDNDVSKSLASIAPTNDVCASLNGIDDPDISQSLGHVDDGAFAATMAPSMGPPTSEGKRFEMLRPLAKGGLGKVSIARDNELHREVALKEILPKWADQEESRQRFTLEAEVTGGLEHPGIVPVYGLGHSSDGRPYYAMRLIQGDSLREALTKFHDTDSQSSQYVLEIHKLLARFIAMCNALHYAHSRGVLHRDLKPDNVMLGEYGETLVVDWGLAKLDDQVAESTIGNTTIVLRPPASQSQPPEQQGHTYGTPAYMSPEQADGDVDRVGVRSDVYGLGAILYHLVTGKRPIETQELEKALRQASRGEFPRPREAAKHVPKPLEAICLKAMAFAPKERYPTAAALAEDVQRWMADEPVEAYRENTQERLSRWIRRHRSVAMSLVAIAALSIVAAIVINGYRMRAVTLKTKAETAEADAIVARDNEAVERAKAEAAEREARESKAVALANFRRARDAVNTWTTGPAADLDGYPAVRAYRERLLRRAVDDYRILASQRSDDPDIEVERARTLLRLGEFQFDLNELDEAMADYQTAAEVLSGVTKERPDLRDVVIEQVNAQRGMGHVARAQGKPKKAETLFSSAVSAVDKATSTLDRSDPHWAEFQQKLGTCRADLGQVLILLDRPQDAEGSLRDALVAYRAAFGVRAMTAQDREDVAYAQRLLAKVLTQRGAFDEAETVCRDAISYTAELTNRNPNQFHYMLANGEANEILAELLFNRGRLNESLDIYNSVQASFASMTQLAAGLPQYREAVARVTNQLGSILYRLRRTNEAKPYFIEASNMYAELAATSPDVPRYRRFEATTRDSLGQLFSDLGEQSRSLEQCAKAHELLAVLRVNYQPEVPLEIERRLGIVYSHLGLIHQNLGNTEEAIYFFGESIRLLDAIVSKLPQARNDLGRVTMHIARLTATLPDKASEVPALQTHAMNIWKPLLSQAAPSPEFLHDFALDMLLSVRPTSEQITSALEAASRAAQVVPDSGDYVGTVGAAQYRMGKFQEALTWLRKAKELRGRATAAEAYFQAMCEFKLPGAGNARGTLEAANVLFEAQLPGNLTVRQLKEEATSLLESDPP